MSVSVRVYVCIYIICVCVRACVCVCVYVNMCIEKQKGTLGSSISPSMQKVLCVCLSVFSCLFLSLSLSAPAQTPAPPSVSLYLSLSFANTYQHSCTLACTHCLSFFFVTHANAYESVMSHMNESYHIRINHVTYKQVVSHMNESLSVFLEREWEREGKKRELLQLVVLVSIYIYVYICIFWSTNLSCQHESSLLSSLLSTQSVDKRVYGVAAQEWTNHTPNATN